MEKVSLADFVAETLASISDGVRRAQDHSFNAGGIPIAPSSVDGQKLDYSTNLVKFNVTLEVEAASSKSGKGQLGGPLVALVAGSMDGSLSQERKLSSFHNIEFSIPMQFHLNYANAPKSKGSV
jgi:hypothetical protein